MGMTHTNGVATQADGAQPPGPLAYEPTAILTVEQVAAWLQVSVRSVERLDLKCVYLGTRTRRYLAKHVLEYLEDKVA